MREDVVRTRAARSLVLPINRRIAEWQLDAARLRAQSGHLDREKAERLLAAVDRLESEVNDHLEHLAGVLRTTPHGELEEGRVLDTLRALKSLHHSLHGTRSQLTAGAIAARAAAAEQPHSHH